MDKIILQKMEFYGYHGLIPEEKKLGQRFIVDAELHIPLQVAGETDDMKESIDYGKVYEVIAAIVNGESKNLIETVAETIASDLLNTFDKLTACTITVKKPDPPINGNYEAVAVQIHRGKR